MCNTICRIGHGRWHLAHLGSPEAQRRRIDSGRRAARPRWRGERCRRHDAAREHDRGEKRIRQFAQGHTGSAAAAARNDQLADLPATPNGTNFSDS